MIPGINPSQMKKLMKMMKAEELDVEEVIIKFKDGSEKCVKEPQVTKMNVMGNDMLQVQGELEDVSTISDDDIKMVIDQAKVDYKTARKALEEAKGDIAEAILKIKQ